MTTIKTSATDNNADAIETTEQDKPTLISTSAEAKSDEATTTASSDNTTTDEQKESKQNEKDLLAEGIKLITAKDYATASSVLSDAMQIMQEKADIATSIASANYYIAYGESLLRLTQSQNDLFAAPTAPEPTQPLETTESASNGKEENNDDDNNDDEEEQKGDQAQEVANGVVDTSEDREIAWETFEYARSIISEFLAKDENKNNEKYIKMLANVHSFLGEICIEDENNENALSEFETALKLQSQCKNESIHCREKAFNRFYACLAAQFCEKDELAKEHCNAALDELSKGICQKLAHFEECKENIANEDLIKFVNECMTKMGDKNEKIKEELKELVGFMEDLLSKLEELEQGIKWKKENPQSAQNEDANAIDAMGDPLQALISGLSSRFGIDEAELAKMSAMDAQKRDVMGSNEGVTTIGFGNDNNGKVEEDDAEINELGSFGAKNKDKKEENVEKVASKKRSFNETEIEDEVNELNVTKKMKLNSGNAHQCHVAAEKKKE